MEPKDLLKLEPLGAILIALLLIYPIYYICGPYSHLDRWYEEQRWQSPEDALCNQSVNDTLMIESVRCSRYIADFLKEEPDVEITVKNLTTTTIKISSISLDIEPIPSANSTGQPYIKPIGSNYQSNSVTNIELQPSEKKVISFSVWASGGVRGQEFSLRFGVETERFKPCIPLNLEWNPLMRFRLWITRQFLLPPGINAVIPVIVIISVILGARFKAWWVSFKDFRTRFFGNLRGWVADHPWKRLLRRGAGFSPCPQDKSCATSLPSEAPTAQIPRESRTSNTYQSIIRGIFALMAAIVVLFLLPTGGSRLMLVAAVVSAGFIGCVFHEEKQKPRQKTVLIVHKGLPKNRPGQIGGGDEEGGSHLV